MSPYLALTALDGSNPLAFLAALGTLRLLQLDAPRDHIAMRWTRQPVWRPEIAGVADSPTVVCERLLAAARSRLPRAALAGLGADIPVDRPTFTPFVAGAAAALHDGDRGLADFAAAFGCEVCEQKEKGRTRIEYTDFCFITGSGHQHFLGTMCALAEKVTGDHIADALFGCWKKDKRLSMRWDPADAAEYALRWGDPSAEGASAVWGANLLAVHALPLLPTQPTERGLRTTAFLEGRRGGWPQFTWPLWTSPIGLEVVRSLLAHPGLCQREGDVDRAALRAMGVGEVFRAPRVRIGQGANFKVSFRPARSL